MNLTTKCHHTKPQIIYNNNKTKRIKSNRNIVRAACICVTSSIVHQS